MTAWELPRFVVDYGSRSRSVPHDDVNGDLNLKRGPMYEAEPVTVDIG